MGIAGRRAVVMGTNEKGYTGTWDAGSASLYVLNGKVMWALTRNFKYPNQNLCSFNLYVNHDLLWLCEQLLYQREDDLKPGFKEGQVSQSMLNLTVLDESCYKTLTLNVNVNVKSRKKKLETDHFWEFKSKRKW